MNRHTNCINSLRGHPTPLVKTILLHFHHCCKSILYGLLGRRLQDCDFATQSRRLCFRYIFCIDSINVRLKLVSTASSLTTSAFDLVYLREKPLYDNSDESKIKKRANI